MHDLIPIDWAMALEETLDKKEINELFNRVEQLYKEEEVLPIKENIFKALELTAFDDVKVVILGQDPYPDPKNAMGLAFSVKEGVPAPASLKNIYNEISKDLKCPMNYNNGNLISWAEQGVLLLNTALTVKAWEANSHRHLNWLQFTSKIIEAVSKKEETVVFLLWGRNAHALERYIVDNDCHRIIKTSHPSPLGYTKNAPISFKSSSQFLLTNNILRSAGLTPINWRIE